MSADALLELDAAPLAILLNNFIYLNLFLYYIQLELRQMGNTLSCLLTDKCGQI